MKHRYAVPQQPVLTCSRVVFFTLLFGSTVSLPAWSQSEPAADPHAGHQMPKSELSAKEYEDKTRADAMDPGSMDHSKMDHSKMKLNSDDAEEVDHSSMDMGSMDMSSMDMGPMQGGSAPDDARDPHAYADGQDFGPFPLHLGDTMSFGSLLVENFEFVDSGSNGSAAYDLQGWYGRVYDRAIVKAEGDFDDGKLEQSRTELVWSHAIAPYWDSQVGVRVDGGEGPSRKWLAFGIQGLAPYWFETEITGYLGENGRTAVRLDASYELLFTQKLVLQPRLEADIFGKNDRARGLGSGLTEVSAQLRLRYEIRREFAPYIGFEWTRKFGKTKKFARMAGDHASDFNIVAGLRYWF